jgi:hypothetical protein
MKQSSLHLDLQMVIHHFNGALQRGIALRRSSSLSGNWVPHELVSSPKDKLKVRDFPSLSPREMCSKHEVLHIRPIYAFLIYFLCELENS